MAFIQRLFEFICIPVEKLNFYGGLTSNVDFFIIQQEISQAADGAVRKYTDSTPEEERRPEELAHAMRAGAKERTKTLMGKMGKLLAVAAPANTPEFLAEVHYTRIPLLSFDFHHLASTV